MTFSYLLAEGIPGERDQVRLLIGDTDEDTHDLEDEEIDFFLSQEPNIYFAGAAAAEAIARKLQAGYFEDQKVGETRLRTKRVNELKILSDQLRNRGAAHKLPSSGGIFVSETEQMLNNDNIIRGDFFKGMHDFPGTSRRGRRRLFQDF